MKSFSADSRSGLPETRVGATQWPHVPAGVPGTMRGDLYRNLRRSSFPYGRSAESTGELDARELRFVSLESDRFRVTVCPDLGGRMLSIFDRLHHAELLWNQPVIHQDVFGLAGAWSVGGLEFNANRFGHLVHGQATLRTSILGSHSTPQGLVFGAFDEAFGCSWEATICPQENRVAIHIRFKNHSGSSAPAYWWSNIAVPAHRHIRLLMQPGAALHHGVYRPGFDTDRWPRLQGADWSRWLNHHEISSIYLHEPSDGLMGYLNERRGIAFVHHADPVICRGRKLWTIGAGPDRVTWWNRLAEPSFPSYYEMQCGLAPTQLQADMIEPGQTIEWTESYSSIQFHADTDEPYEEIWRRFAIATKPAFESTTIAASMDRTALFQPSVRQQLSERIVLSSEEVTDDEVRAACERGWIAGAAWIRRLHGLSNHTAWTKLSLGAAMLDRGSTNEAMEVLRGCADATHPSGGWASLFLGRELRAQGKPVDARRYLQRAVTQLPTRVESWSELVRLLLDEGDLDGASVNIQKVPVAIARTDAGRVLHSRVALAAGNWEEVRRLTDAEFHSIAEGEIDAWTLRKEAHLGHAFELAGEGKIMQAIQQLIQAGQWMPQFGTGRDEFAGNGDLLFYRWLLSSRAGNRWAANAMAGLILEPTLHPGVNDAVYAARLAKLINDPSYPQRRSEIDVWNADGVDDTAWPILRRPVLQAMDGDASGFAKLRNHPIYKHRALAEMEWIRACIDKS